MENVDVIASIKRSQGTAVRKAREELGWSQAELAEKAGTSQQTVDRIERGVTEHSRALPAIRDALGLPILGGMGSPQQLENVAAAEAMTEEHKAYPHTISDPITGGYAGVVPGVSADFKAKIPVFSADTPFGPKVVDAIPRCYPVEFVDGAYGVIVTASDMTPVVRIGDVVVVNPHTPPQAPCEVILSSGAGKKHTIEIYTLIEETDDAWRLCKTQSGGAITVQKKKEARVHTIVSKISRFR